LLVSTGIYTLSTAPQNLQASNVGPSQAYLYWEAGSNPAGTKYRILYARRVPPATTFETQQVLVDTSANLQVTTYTATGLLTNTDYRFYVASTNGDGVNSALTTLSYNGADYLTTLGGAAAAKAGYISGLASEGTITGLLPDNRQVTLTIPENAFDDPSTQIAFGVSSTANPCQQTTIPPQVDLPVFEIITSTGVQPKVPVTVKFKYAYTNNVGATHNDLTGRTPASMALARAVSTGNCLTQKTSVSETAQEVTATINHFSDFQLVEPGAASNLENVLIYPNPFFPNQGQIYMYFDRIPAGTKLRLYTLSGVKAWETQKSGVSPITWDGRNSSGEKMASGVYLAVLEGGGEKKIFKVAMER
ncbi:MAG: hypothetical protein GX410_02085, partial [Elusimicrobia bacterium]|nr:hypothetical protein [Elusimicrobiota bacterium]